MTILLDTSVIIDCLNQQRGRREILKSLAEQGHILACCPVIVAEAYAGAHPGDLERTARFLENLAYVPITREASRTAGKLKYAWARKGRTVALADALIAAVTIPEGLALATDNPKDFPMAELKLYPLPRP